MMNGNGKCRTTRRRPSRFQSRQGWDARRPLASLRPVGKSGVTKKVPRPPRTLRDRLDTLHAAQFELEVSRDRYAHLYDFAPVGYVSLSLVGQIIQLNLTAAAMLGRSRAALLKSPFSVCVAKADVSRFLEHLRRCRGSDTKVVTELSLRQPSGAEVPVQLVSSPLPYSLWPGSTLYQTALTDLTGRKQMEDSLRRSEERLHLALRAARAGALDLDLDTGTANWSDGFSDLLGLENRHSLASYETLLASLHPDDRAAAQRILRMVWRRRSNFRAEFRVLHPLKGARWLSLLGRVLRDEDGRPVRLTGIGIDVSERKQSEELLRKASRSLEERVRERTAELRAANVELERQIARRKRLERQLLEVSEHMQRRIGQDLHDGLGQQLTGLRYLNNVLHEKLAQKSLPEADDSERLAQLLEQAKSQVRQLARGLHPVAIVPDGLMTALGQLADSVAQLHRVGCRFDCPKPVLIADNVVATHLFRIAQEAVNNALRHGRARQITLALTANNGTLDLQVQNDGRILPARRQGEPGLGLQIMKSRSEAMGAVLEVRPLLPGGMLVRCSVPLPKSERLVSGNEKA